MTSPSYVLPVEQNRDQQRKRINAVFADLAARQGGYGAGLPADVAPDGTLYAKMGTPNHLYQAQGGVWVLIL